MVSILFLFNKKNKKRRGGKFRRHFTSKKTRVSPVNPKKSTGWDLKNCFLNLSFTI